ncbi:MAG: hypothetical protein PCFJNLEI_00594 [Verrucomicrobiae bacterium]|nr:hypothetical protein [Verrucomicrobiae bacterium]
MNQAEQDAILTICLMAAFADGGKDDRERAEIKRICETLPQARASALYQRVLLRQVTLRDAAALLTANAHRQLAYEMAVCVAEADEALTESEKQFLSELRTVLGLAAGATQVFEKQAEAVATAPVTAPVLPANTADVDAEVDKTILNYAILNAALELLPESLATMAIVPLQIKMVYRVGARYGHQLGRGHIKELLATAGVGLTSQVVEGYARKLVGGFLGKAGGGLLRGLGQQAASSGLTFATTYALGHMAKKYYAGGRTLSALQLRELFEAFKTKAQSLHGQHAGAIDQQARQVSVTDLLPLIRSQSA